MQFHAAKADAEGEATDRATVDASEARSGADADAFTERGDDFNLLLAGKYVREGAVLWLWSVGDSGYSARQGVYSG